MKRLGLAIVLLGALIQAGCRRCCEPVPQPYCCQPACQPGCVPAAAPYGMQPSTTYAPPPVANTRPVLQAVPPR